LFGAVFLFSEIHEIIGKNKIKYKTCGIHVALLLAIGTHDSGFVLFPEIY
jgi:hypothetical protein